MKQAFKVTAALLLAGLLLPATAALAGDVFWNAASDYVDAAGVWNPAAPIANDNVNIANNGTALVNADHTFGVTLRTIYLGNSAGNSGNITQTGGAVAMGGSNFVFGNRDNVSGLQSVYDLQGGTFTSTAYGVIGLGTGANGKLKISSDAVFNDSSVLYLGDGGATGYLDMSGNGQANVGNFRASYSAGTTYVTMVDSADIVGANASNWFGRQQGTLVDVRLGTVATGDGHDDDNASIKFGTGDFRIGEGVSSAPTDKTTICDVTVNLYDHTSITTSGKTTLALWSWNDVEVNLHDHSSFSVLNSKDLIISDANDNSGAYNVGTGSHAAITVADNASLSASNWVVIGNLNQGHGSLEVKDNGSLSVTGSMRVGNGAGKGTLTLKPTNPGDVVTATVNGSIFVGQAGVSSSAKSDGKLYIHSGTNLTVGSLYAGESGYADGLIEMTGGTVNVGGWLALARTGPGTSGTLNMSGDAVINANGVGGLVLISNGYSGTGSSGTATLSDNARLTSNASDVEIGWGGTGMLTVGDGTATEGTDPGAVVHAGTLIRLCNDIEDGTAILNLKVGGTVETPYITSGPGVSATINLDGGLLKVLADDTPETPFISNPGAVPTFAINVLNDGARIDTNSHNATIDEALVEDGLSTGGGLTKLGEGVLTLTKACSYTGDTSVEAGALAINGSITSEVNIAADAVLMGNGTIDGSVTAAAGSSVAPGNSIGTLTVTGDLTLGGTLDVEYDGDTSTIDMLAVSGELDLNGGTLSFSNWGTQPLANGAYVFAAYGTLTGAPATEAGLLPGWFVDYAYDYNGGVDNSIALVAVPEPSILVLFVGLAVAMAGCRVRR